MPTSIPVEALIDNQLGAPMSVNVTAGVPTALTWNLPDAPAVKVAQFDRGTIGAVEMIDPYAELRWSSWALVNFSADLAEKTLDTAAQCDILQRMRTVVGYDIFKIPELKSLSDQMVKPSTCEARS